MKTYLKPGELVIGTADSSYESESLELISNFEFELPNVLDEGLGSVESAEVLLELVEVVIAFS